jgi:hypothetical protein
MHDDLFYTGLQQQSPQDIYNFLSWSSTELWILQVQFTLKIIQLKRGRRGLVDLE